MSHPTLSAQGKGEFSWLVKNKSTPLDCTPKIFGYKISAQVVQGLRREETRRKREGGDVGILPETFTLKGYCVNGPKDMEEFNLTSRSIM